MSATDNESLGYSFHNDNNNIWKNFERKSHNFMEKTDEIIFQGINPGGIYQAIWCRDASYILKDWFLSGNVEGTVRQIYDLWCHQISPNGIEKIFYGRGSPNMKFISDIADTNKEKEFEGALPTTIYQNGFSEVYGEKPDIDSTALMISTTAWILSRCLSLKEDENIITKNNNNSKLNYNKRSNIAKSYLSSYSYKHMKKLERTNTSMVAEFVIPRMFKAVQYLISRDIDDDCILEQSYNEDWMDTVLRTGKIVYSQACWIMALTNLSILLSKIKEYYKESIELKNRAQKTEDAVDKELWSESNSCYLDNQSNNNNIGLFSILTQDVTLYLVAITLKDINIENKKNKSIIKNIPKEKSFQKDVHSARDFIQIHLSRHLYQRSKSTLNEIKNRCRKNKWPVVTEKVLKVTGPCILKPYEYHNYTFWPWITGIEMLARSRFEEKNEYNVLLPKLINEDPKHMNSFYEWTNPITNQGKGSYPFRTGISSIRIALLDIFGKIDVIY